MIFSRKIETIQPSQTLGITSKAKAMIAKGEDVVVLAAGEPDFDTPQVIKDAAIKAIQAGQTKYTPSTGTKSLKEAICRKLKKDNALDYSIEEIVVSNGAKHSLYNVFQVICSPGDEVLIIPPYWLSYPEIVKLADAKPIFIPTARENNFKIKPEDVRSKITKKTKAIIINSPSNPAGVVYLEKELREITQICVDAGIMIISDEIYEKIIFDGVKHFSPAQVSNEARSKTILVNGVSKSYSMTGWRIGYAAASKEIVERMAVLQDHSTSNPCSISQAASECALSADLQEEIKNNCKKFEEKRNALIELLQEEKRINPFKPQGAFYLFCDISKCGLDSMTFSERLLKEKKVAVIPGAPFGDDKYIRISFATSLEKIKEGAKRIKEFVQT